MVKTVRTKKTAKNDWGLLHLRASMLYHNYLAYAPVRTKRFWSEYMGSKKKGDIQDAYLATLAFEFSFKRV